MAVARKCRGLPPHFDTIMIDPHSNVRIAPSRFIMPRPPFLNIAMAFATSAILSVAHAQVYKCTDAGGKTIYADTPCDAAAKPLKLPGEASTGGTNPNVCAQMQDEMRRLAAEAERTAQRGGAESASSLKRRQGLTRQYEARCVGVSRSAPTAK